MSAAAVRRFKSTSVLATGRVLAFDPATGRGESRPGWAWYVAGELVESGVLQYKGGALAGCLSRLHGALLDLVERLGQVDAFVVEELRGKMVHPHLTWSVGVAVAAVNCPLTLELSIWIWKAWAAIDPNYTKGDEADAILIGRSAVGLARGNQPPGGGGPRGRRPSNRRRAAAAGRVRPTNAVASGSKNARPTRPRAKPRRPQRRSAK